MPRKNALPSKRDVQALLKELAFDPRAEGADAIFKNPEIYDPGYLIRNVMEQISSLVRTKDKPVNEITATIDDSIRKLLIARLSLKSK